MSRWIWASLSVCLASGCGSARVQEAPSPPGTSRPSIASAIASISAPPADPVAEPALSTPELPFDPVFDWLGRIGPENVDSQVIFDPVLGVRYASSAVSLKDGERTQVGRLLCDAKEIAELARDVVARRQGPNGELARCNETPTSARCFLVGWHDAPNYTIELRRPSPTTYLIVSIERAGMSWGEGPDLDAAFTAAELARLRAKRCPRK